MITDRYQNHVALDFPEFGPPLLLARTPKYLRFVRSLAKTWDALDQLDDEPKDEETIIVGVLDGYTSLHIDRVDPKTRRRVGEWVKMLTYKLPPAQPPEDVVRDTAKWRAWCEEQIAKVTKEMLETEST